MSSQLNIKALVEGSEDIVISGMSGRFPESDNTDEFAKNLYNNVDMITCDDRRWPPELYSINDRMGKLKELDRFDGPFFGILPLIGHSIDPQARLLLETTYEAIVDAGVNPQSLWGTETGVYIGFSSIGMPEGIPEEIQPDLESSLRITMTEYPGTAKCIYANRISFIFNFKGPSMMIDTACSSSLVAFDVAVTDLRLGKCNQAIVGGVNVNLQPFTNNMYHKAGVTALDGRSKVWDEEADGFVRGEGIVSLFLQRKSDSKRIYATVLHSRVNIDGNKKVGMFYPSSEAQQELMERALKEANIDPLKVNYFEAHGTGTKVGDPQEAKAIFNAFCKGREGTLPIGLLKSNVGHGEAASGASSIVKILISYENECIPANLNLNKLKSIIAEMCPPLFPINENLPYSPGIVGVNNFGLGGVNATALLEPNYKKSDSNALKIADKIPRLVNICGRTQDSVNQMFDFIEKNPNKITQDFLALICDTMKVKPSLNSSGFPFRGSMLITKMKEENNEIQYQYKRQSSMFIGKSLRPVWFLFPGLGGQWTAMAKALMPIDIFANKIEECHQILKPFGIDLKYLLLTEDKNSISTMTNKFVATTAIQIALFDVLHKLGIIPDGIIGHSFGEIACAYADGCLTTEEALLTTYYRGVVTESDKRIPKGIMAAIGLSWDETKKLCPPGVDVVCNNSKDTVVVSGIYNETKELIKSLTEKNIFVRELESSGIPYHSQYLQTCEKSLIDKLKEVISDPKIRSEKWISTAILESETDKEELKTASAEYFVHNLLSPVFFHNKLPLLPKDAIVVEIGPHGLFAKIVGQTLETSTYMSLIKRDQNETNLETFLTSIGKLYELGLNPSIENLYPKVLWPVSRNTQSISSLIKWDHKDEYLYKKYPHFYFRGNAADMHTGIFIQFPQDFFFMDHSIDGNIIYPATGYIMLAWRQLAASLGKHWINVSVVFEDIQFRRPTFLSDFEPTFLTVKFLGSKGEFTITENNNIVCFGRIYESESDTLHVQNLIYEKTIDEENESDSMILDTNDVYKDMKTRGYDYGPHFRGIKQLKVENCEHVYGKVEWTGNPITFLDSLLQTQIMALPFKKMFVPITISSLRCDPKVLFEAVEKNKINVKEEELKAEELKGIEEDVGKFEKTGFYKSDEIPEEEPDLANRAHQIFEKINEFGYHKYKSELPFYGKLTSKLIVTHGIEFKGILAVPISRKGLAQDLKLESYQFIANEENDAIEEVERQELLEYIKVCSSLALKVYDLNNNKKIIEKEFEEKLINKYLVDIKEEYVMIKIFNNLLNYKKDENENILDNKYRDENLDKMKVEFETKSEFDLTNDIINKVSKNERFIRPLLDIVSENNVPKKDIKVIEINLSYALMALEVDNYLGSAAIYPISVDYTLINNNIENISEEYKKKSYKLQEWDQNKKSFPEDLKPSDLVIFRDSRELWHLDLEKYLQEVYDTIVMKGFLLSVFRYKFTEPELTLYEMFGKNNLKISDFEQRIHEFINMATKIGFTVICRKTDSIGSLAILLRKVVSNTKVDTNKDNIIEINNNFENWLELIKNKISEIKESDNKDKNLWLIANDSSINGIIGLTNCLRLESGGERIRCIFDYDKQLITPLNFNEKPFSDILINDLAINVIRNGKVGTYRHLSLPKNYDQIETHDYYLNSTINADLSGLKLFDAKNIKPDNTFVNLDNRKFNQIRCNVYSAGLNFRDVMTASGRIMSPLSLFSDCTLGFEFAGRRSDTGERICGFGMGRTMASFVDVREDLITTIPEHWSMDDSVTILTTYCTVWYGLIERAQLLKKESILIHSGAGGVGQAAIAVCQYYNCDIFTTVGNEDKKQFLMKEYNIPENRIFNSRDAQFEYKIMDITDGKGVDIVLNSLTGDKLDASFRCVADDGRFVEIGKYDLQMNKQLGMFAFLRNISFLGVSADRILFMSEVNSKKFFDWMHENSKNGCIKPINRNIFEITEGEQAFRYMTTGKHTGKIIIKIRDEEQQKNALKEINPTLRLKATVKTFFDPKKVYIITGGLGGFGLELMQWMLFNNAKNIVLTSRYGIKNNYQKFILDRLESLANQFEMFKSNIIVSTHDSNTIEGAQQLLEEANKLGPIGGIFHLSLVLNDALFENQTIDTFRETFDSKVKTFENLDKLTRNSCRDLDYFVVFSSVSCGKGNSGQTNYGFANSVCERICELRRRDGLHGLAIQWGPIGDVGVIADKDIVDSLAAVVKQRMNSCMEVMDTYLQCPHPILSSTVRAKRVLSMGTNEQKMMNQLWSVLGVDPKVTPNHLTLGELGLESMYAVELQQNLERDYDIKLSLADVKTITVKQLKDFESGNKDEIRKFSEDIKKARAILAKMKFIIPTETHTKLNSVQSGRPIYFLPPLEGIYSMLENLAKSIKRPVIGLNATRETQALGSISEVCNYYLKLLQKLSPNGNYDIVGHTFGATIVPKMLRKGPINKAVIIDTLMDSRLNEDLVNDENLFEFVSKSFVQVLPENIRDRFVREIEKIPTVEEKLKRMSSELKEFGGKSMVSKDLDEILKDSLKRSKMIISYRSKAMKKIKQQKVDLEKKYMKMKGKLFIIKPLESSDEKDIVQRICDLYFVPETALTDLSEYGLTLETIDEKVDDLLTENYEKLAKVINNFLP